MHSSNLPSQPTPFIGRAKELAEISALMANPDCRLLTLVGPGGIGKTRLAVNTARQQQSGFPDGVYFIALQPLSAPDFIISATAEAINFQLYTGGEPKQQLLDYLSEKSLLLVLDNFEHLLDAVTLVSDILSAAPSVKLLVTSRERLNLLEEWVLEVQGLPVPSSEAENEITHYDAVQLFLQNAQRVQVGFTLSEAHKPAVTRICRLVGGMPLGIELAAAWVRALSCEEIAAEIERSMDILATPARNVPPRHRNMRAALEHSWKLLTDEERAVFKKLSVFRGGFRKEAAQAVTGASLPTLSALVDKSLLRVNANGRYEIHELLRQYAQEKLTSSAGEREQTLNLFSTYYAELVGQCEHDVRGSNFNVAQRKIADDIDNIRQAWERAVTETRPQEVERYLWGLYLFYERQGWLFEGEEAFDKAVQAFEIAAKQQADEADNRDRERVLGQLYSRQAVFSIRLGYYAKGEDLLLKSLALLRPLDFGQEIAVSLIGLGGCCIYRNEYSEAEAALAEAIAICRERNLLFELVWALDHKARLLRSQGHPEQARQILEESIRLSKANGIGDIVSETFIELGQVMEALGNYEAAKQAYLDALAVRHNLPFSPIVVYANIYLGRIAHIFHDDDEAALCYHRALEVSKRLGSFRFKLDVLLGVTEFQAKHGERARYAERLALIFHHPVSLAAMRDRAQALLKELESELSPEIVAIYREKGKVAKLDDALESVYETPLFSHLRSGASTINEAAASRPSSSEERDHLTKREIEILHLMAQGMSNRDIAESLFLSASTVKWYANQIFSKLHTQNRVQTIVRARELNLLS